MACIDVFGGNSRDRPCLPLPIDMGRFFLGCWGGLVNMCEGRRKEAEQACKLWSRSRLHARRNKWKWVSRVSCPSSCLVLAQWQTRELLQSWQLPCKEYSLPFHSLPPSCSSLEAEACSAVGHSEMMHKRFLSLEM